MIEEVKIPEISENVESGTVIRVLVEVGDLIDIEDVLIEFETEKALVDIPSTVSGKITYESVDLFSGRKVAPSKTMLITGTHTANEHGRGTPKATLRAPRKQFPDALRGIFNQKTMQVSARLQETQPMIANTTIRAEHLQRK